MKLEECAGIENRKYFGTDGVRGSVDKGVISPDFVMRLGWAAGRVLAKKGNGGVLIGKDTRISGYMLESALEAGFSAAGIDIRLLGPMPTPGIAYLTKSIRAQAGVVISASHNLFYDNGIKFFFSDGTKLSDSIESEIEHELRSPIQSVGSSQLGKARRINDAPRRYIEFCKSKVNADIDFNGVRIALDCANGAAYHIAPKVFEELGAEVICYAVSPDGLNINDKCGAAYPDALQKWVRESRADVGIALDGDGDRLIMVDQAGRIIDGDDILYIIAKSQIENLNGAIVGTVMSNSGLEYAIEKLNLGFFRASVGDRYVVELLRRKNLLLGGETSGHIVNLGMSTTGDGIIAALQVLAAMIQANKNISELVDGLFKFPQIIRNVKLSHPSTALNLPGIRAAIKDIESSLGKNGRIVVRPSGTESMIRIMLESDNKSKIKKLGDQLVDQVIDGASYLH